MSILDPIERELARLERGQRRALQEVARSVVQRVRLRVPVLTGALRASLVASVHGDEVRLSSPLPYASQHRDEIAPDEAWLEATIRQAVDRG